MPKLFSTQGGLEAEGFSKFQSPLTAYISVSLSELPRSIFNPLAVTAVRLPRPIESNATQDAITFRSSSKLSLHMELQSSKSNGSTLIPSRPVECTVNFEVKLLVMLQIAPSLGEH